MKERLYTLAVLILFIILLPLILVMALSQLIIDLILYPFRYAKYKKSYYYHDFQEKFFIELYTSNAYSIYNAIKASNLPLVATPYRENGKIRDILYTYHDTLLCISPLWFVDYDKEKEKWECEVAIEENEEGEDTEAVDFNEYIAKQIESEVPLLPDIPPTSRMVILLRKDHISDKSLPYAEASERFLIYDKKNIVEVLEKFISEHK